MRSIMIAAVAALAFASAAHAVPGAVSGPYKLDAKGKCHAAGGQFAKQSLCAALTPPHCVKGKLCGNTCIKATDVCHKPVDAFRVNQPGQRDIQPRKSP
jgi:hypothetical protein